MAMSAAQLTPEEALARLREGSAHRLPASATNAPALKLTKSASNGEATLYVFDRSDSNGYFIVSADDSIIPLLGYTDNGNFDTQNVPPALEYWLNEYSRQISFVKSGLLNTIPYETATDNALPQWEPIAPMVKTLWDQGDPYYNECPEIKGRKCYTGCVATSMAQAMNYFKYPEVGQGSIKYTPKTINKPLRLDFSKTAFDWDNMLDTYLPGQYTEEQANAVSYLMKACGYSVQMSYDVTMSGAMSYLIPNALIDYFKYDKGTRYESRKNYSYNEWAKIIYDNLKNIGPVIYDGTAPMEGGHSFICDGYDGNGYFHFNWGWSGMSDGYFTLDALNPSAQGIGGYSGGFNFDQDAVIGMQPPTENPVEHNKCAVQYGNLYGESSGNTLYFGLTDSEELGWGYMGGGSANFSFGAIIEKVDDENAEPLYVESSNLRNVSFQSGTYFRFDSENYAYYPQISLKNLKLESGTPYKVTFACKDINAENSVWTPVQTINGYYNYIIITKKGLSYEIENFPIANFSVSNPEMLSNLYYGCPVKIKTTISNNSNIQLSRGLCVMLIDSEGKERFTSSSILVTLDPEESVEKEWITTLYRTSGSAVNSPTEFTLKFYDIETNTYYDMEPVTVTMQKNPGNPTIISSLTIENAALEDDIYKVIDNNEIDINLSLRIGKGYFAYPITIYVMASSEDDPNYLLPVINETVQDIPFLNKGENTSINSTLNFANPEPDKLYYIKAAYINDNTYNWLRAQAKFIVDKSGVESVNDDTDQNMKFFYDKMNQKLVILSSDKIEGISAHYANGVAANVDVVENIDNVVIDLSKCGKNILIVRATNHKGKTKTIKVSL